MAHIDDPTVEQAARKLRIEVGVDDRFCPDMIFVPHELKRTKKINDFVLVPDGHMEDEASYDSDERIVHIRDSVFRVLDRLCHGPKQERRRARFTIAHELGHLNWRHDGKHFRGATSDRVAAIGSRVRFREPEANRFGAAFLVPARLARAEMSPEHLSELFDINISAAILRKEALERMDRQERGVHKPLPKGVADWLRGQREKGYTISSLNREDARKLENGKKNGEDDKK